MTIEKSVKATRNNKVLADSTDPILPGEKNSSIHNHVEQSPIITTTGKRHGGRVIIQTDQGIESFNLPPGQTVTRIWTDSQGTKETITFTSRNHKFETRTNRYIRSQLKKHGR